MLWYPINVYTSQLNDDVSNNCKTIADLSGARKWAELLDYLKDHLRGSSLDRINMSRLPVDESSKVDLRTALHLAAEGNAPIKVFEKLLELGASKSLKDAEGNTAYDIGKKNGLSEDILSLIEIPTKIRENEAVIKKMEAGLHQIILAREDWLIQSNGQILPQLVFLYEFEDFFYPVPGMYGGFRVTKHDDGVQVVSFCRISGGSGQRHVIDTEGNVELVETDLM